MEGYFDFKDLVYRLAAGVGYDISQMPEPRKIPLKRQEKETSPILKQRDITDCMQNLAFNHNGLVMSLFYNPNHKAIKQSLHIQREGVERTVLLEESDHRTSMYIKGLNTSKTHPRYEEVPLVSFDVREIYRQIRQILLY